MGVYDHRAAVAALLTTYSLDEPAWARRVLGVWARQARELYPQYADRTEPIRRTIGNPPTESETERLGGLWLARRAGPKVGFGSFPGFYWHAMLNLEVQHPATADLAAVVRWADGLADTVQPVFGCVHTLSLAELQAEPLRPDIIRPYPGSDREATLVPGSTKQLGRGLSTLYWRTYLGQPYVDLFGTPAIASLPAFAVEERPWGVVVQLTPEAPTDATWPAFRVARDAVAQALGLDAFGPQATRRPTFTVFGLPDPG